MFFRSSNINQFDTPVEAHNTIKYQSTSFEDSSLLQSQNVGFWMDGGGQRHLIYISLSVSTSIVAKRSFLKASL